MDLKIEDIEYEDSGDLEEREYVAPVIDFGFLSFDYEIEDIKFADPEEKVIKAVNIENRNGRRQEKRELF